MAMTSSDIALRVAGVTKAFGPLLANDAISFDVKRGEVVALLGENGAGKTTLMNIVFGHYVADAGHVEAHGEMLRPGDPQAALAAGIGMVHQHFALADNLTVLENLMLGTERLWLPWSDRRDARERLRQLSARAGLVIDPQARVGRLTVGERQRVEILKALYRDARVLILDEPTAVLTPQEAESLFATLRKLVGLGLSIIFISHKLGEVLDIADRIVVLRQGRVVLERMTEGATRDDLATAMVGRQLVPPQLGAGTAKGVALRLHALDAGSADGRQRLHGIDLTIGHGEIVGIAGVAGNGQSLLADILCGVAVPAHGGIELDGESMECLTPRGALAAGIGRVPEDRHASGVVGDMDLSENAILERIGDRRFSTWGWRNPRAARTHAAALIAEFDIRGATPRTQARLLSGGNMQKLILGRVLTEHPKVIIANQPTRGLDVGAVLYVQERLAAARRDGAGILLISEDLDELLALSDRIGVMYRGRLSACRPRDALDIRTLGLMMAGAGFGETSHAS